MNLLDELAFQEKWIQIEAMLVERFGKKPDMEAILYLIGINELGDVPNKSFTKEQKQDLMHIAICKVLSFSGIYELEGTDQDGWPHWKLVQPLPFVNLLEQEKLLKAHVIEYFEKEVFNS